MEDLKTFDQFLSEAQGEKAKSLKTTPPNEDKGTDTEKNKENAFQKSNDASHGEKAQTIKESDDVIIHESLSQTGKEAYLKNKTKKVGERFVDVGEDQDASGIILHNKRGTMLIGYKKDKGFDLMIIDTVTGFNSMIDLNDAEKQQLKKLLT